MFNYWQAKIYILICWIFFIFILIATPIPTTGSSEFTIYDKVVHFFLFGILSFLFAWTLRPYAKRKNWRGVNMLILIVVTSYILGGEYLQTLIPGREPALGDILAGLSGMLLGLIFINTYPEKV